MTDVILYEDYYNEAEVHFVEEQLTHELSFIFNAAWIPNMANYIKNKWDHEDPENLIILLEQYKSSIPKKIFERFLDDIIIQINSHSKRWLAQEKTSKTRLKQFSQQSTKTEMVFFPKKNPGSTTRNAQRRWELSQMTLSSNKASNYLTRTQMEKYPGMRWSKRQCKISTR